MSSVKASPFDWRKKDSIFLADRNFTLEAAISNISKANNAAQPQKYTTIRNDMTTTFAHTCARNSDLVVALFEPRLLPINKIL